MSKTKKTTEKRNDAAGYGKNMTFKTGEVVTDNFKNPIRDVGISVDVFRDCIENKLGVEYGRKGEMYVHFTEFATKDEAGQNLTVLKPKLAKK